MRVCAQRKTRPCRPDITAAAASVLYQLRSQANNLTDQVIAPLSVSTTVPSVTCRLPPTPHFLSTSFDPRSNGRRLAQIGPTSPPGPGSTRRRWSQVMAPPVPVLETDRRRRLVVSPALQTLLLGSGWFLGRFLGGEGGEGGLVPYAVLPHRKIGQLAQTRSRGGAPPRVARAARPRRRLSAPAEDEIRPSPAFCSLLERLSNPERLAWVPGTAMHSTFSCHKT